MDGERDFFLGPLFEARGLDGAPSVESPYAPANMSRHLRARTER